MSIASRAYVQQSIVNALLTVKIHHSTSTSHLQTEPLFILAPCLREAFSHSQLDMLPLLPINITI